MTPPDARAGHQRPQSPGRIAVFRERASIMIGAGGAARATAVSCTEPGLYRRRRLDQSARTLRNRPDARAACSCWLRR